MAEAVENNSEIAKEYGISESIARRWRKDQANLLNGELKMSAKRKMMGCYMQNYPDLDQTLLKWFSEQRCQGIAVRILRLKTKELCSDPEFKLPRVGTRIGKGAMSSACNLRQPWLSDFLKIWKRRRSSFSVRDCSLAMPWLFAIQDLQS